MDNLFEDSDDSEGTESKAGPDIDEIPEDNEIPGEPQLADEEEEGEKRKMEVILLLFLLQMSTGISFTKPDLVEWFSTSFPLRRTFQPGETLRFDVVSGCPMGEPDTDGDLYETFMEHFKATGLRILPVPVRMGYYCRIPFPSERIDTRRDFADYTPLQSRAEFSALATAGLIRVEARQRTCNQRTL
jgi:hypothetical protein